MNTSLAIVRSGSDFAEQIETKRREIEADVTSAGRGFGAKMADLVALQNAEILRLQGILHDATTIPPRHAVAMSVSAAITERGIVKHVLLATANDGSNWLMENYSPDGRPEFYKWGRVPNLPQASEEADAGR